MKAEPLVRALESSGTCEVFLVHTGQHYDPSLSMRLFNDLGLRLPDRHLGIGSGSRSEQLARIMLVFEKTCLELAPDIVIVVGDVNSTLAAAIVSQSLGIRLAHVEAGLRSGDLTMPEETNRRLTDALSDLLFTPTEQAGENLLREGISPSRIHFVGNIMIDSLLRCLPLASTRKLYARWRLRRRGYALMTVHRPNNVDDREALKRLVTLISRTAEVIPLIFSIHPRTMTSLERFGLQDALSTVAGAYNVYPPLSYLDFLGLMANARVVLTDSGGVQEETSVLGIPCLTLRSNTERPITLTEGTNRLVGADPSSVMSELEQTLRNPMPRPSRPPLWDGHTAERVIRVVLGVEESMTKRLPQANSKVQRGVQALAPQG